MTAHHHEFVIAGLRFMQMAYFETTKNEFKDGSLQLIEGQLLKIRDDDEQLAVELLGSDGGAPYALACECIPPALSTHPAVDTQG